MIEPTLTQVPQKTPKAGLTLSWRTLALLLLLIIGVMTYLWKPWEHISTGRNITVTGEATISAVPDLYTFQPVFENADVKVVTTAGNQAVAQLKQLGVANADIKTTTSSSNPVRPQLGIYPPVPVKSASTFELDVVVHDKTLAQKVSDYLSTTTATGTLTPATSFSPATQSKLDLEARTKASADARAKADVIAKQLGAHIRRVNQITEGGNLSVGSSLDTGSGVNSSQALKASGPIVQPGTGDVNYSFTVEFELN